MRLVYPIAVEKWILKYPQAEGEDSQSRKSPKRGRPVEVFAELVSLPKLVLAPNFTLELVMIQEEELRRYSSKRRWRYNGWETVERRLITVLEQRTFQGPDLFVGLLPPDLPDTFTTADISAGLAIPRWLAQKMAYCLREMGALEGLVFGAYDLIVTTEGETVFLEVNPMGQWLWLEKRLNLDISQAIAQALLDLYAA